MTVRRRTDAPSRSGLSRRPCRLLKNYSDPADDSLSFQIRFSFVPAILQNKMGTLEFFSSLLVIWH